MVRSTEATFDEARLGSLGARAAKGLRTVKLNATWTVGIITVAATLFAIPFASWWNDFRKGSENVVDVAAHQSFLRLSADDVEAIRKRSNYGVYFSVYDATATGREDIGSKSIILISGAPFIAAGTIKAPAENPANVTITTKKNAVEVSYRLFAPGERHRFWVAQEFYSPPTISKGTTGLAVNVRELTDDHQDDRKSFLPIIVAMIGGALTLGTVIQARSTSRVFESAQRVLKQAQKVEAAARAVAEDARSVQTGSDRSLIEVARDILRSSDEARNQKYDG